LTSWKLATRERANKAGKGGMRRPFACCLEKEERNFISLIDNETWDAVITVESMPDQFFHKFWANKQALS
jgi:hypothetical protein